MNDIMVVMMKENKMKKMEKLILVMRLYNCRVKWYRLQKEEEEEAQY